MKLKTAVVAAFAWLVACAPAKEDFGQNAAPQDRALEIPAKERAQTLPNDLFKAVYNNSPAQVDKVAQHSPVQLLSQNVAGDTPLGLALRAGYKSVADRLLQVMPIEGLTHQNAKGEGYVFLAARSGFPEFITAIADKYYSSLGGVLDDYEFKVLDREDGEGRRALSVAADRSVAEALERQYYRGFLEAPFWNFTMHSDNRSRSFLHWAAADGRDDVISWANERLCAPGNWEKSDHWWLAWPSQGLTYGLRALQTHALGDWGLPTDVLVNRTDNDYMSALHVAVAERRWNSVRALASCRFLDFDLQDAHYDTPLHAFLEALNPFLATQDKEARETFSFLLAKNTLLRLATPSYRVNRVNADGNTPLHLAAGLADPYFYQQLATIGDIYALDAKGRSAESLFKARQEQVKRHAQ
ncbi:MAG: hypothetical protein KF799_01045 [Bdellovibrionales bacterium]|nr:hypothetical protein [Bdellovibrionales bacterium]